MQLGVVQPKQYTIVQDIPAFVSLVDSVMVSKGSLRHFAAVYAMKVNRKRAVTSIAYLEFLGVLVFKWFYFYYL